MQRRIIISTLALLAACGSASARSVTMYGIVDAAVEHVTNVGASGDSLNRLPSNTGRVPARPGFRGSEVNAGLGPAGTNCHGENAADTKACREWSALVKYDDDTWGAALAVDEIRAGAGAFAGLTSSTMKDTRVSANDYVRLGAAKIGAVLSWIRVPRPYW